MKKFEFRLEKILSYKEQLLENETAKLTVLNEKLNKANNKLKTLEAQLADCSKKLEESMLGNVSPVKCRLYSRYVEHLKDLIEIQKAEVTNITAQVNSQIQVIKELKLDSKSLETLKDAQYEEYQKETLKKSENLVEEFISASRIMAKEIS